MMELSVNIEKQLGSFNLKVDFNVGEEVLSLLGASGCGKSMTLKCIAGIEKPDKGRIILNGKTLFDSEKHINLKPQQRRVGYLFQQYALFPNMTVEQNILCAVRDEEKKLSKTEKKRMVNEIIRFMDLEGLEKSSPSRISGGQQQRVALARILVNKPDVMLLDEPFSALDAYLRLRMEREVGKIVREYGKPAIFVSHSRDEVFRISDRIALMDSGSITRIGNRTEVFRDPGSINGAILTGITNISSIGSAEKIAQDDQEAEHSPMYKVYAPDFGIDILVKGNVEGYNSIALQDNHIKFGPELDKLINDGKAGINVFNCNVLDLIENPGHVTALLREENAKEGMIIINIPWSVWRHIDHSKVRIYIFPVGVSLLK